MPSTKPYAPSHDFSTDPDPQSKVNAEALQVELQNVSAQFADLIAALATTIRDDNTLADATVALRNLAPELVTYIESNVTGSVLTNAVPYYQPVRVASTANLGDPTALIGFGQVVDGITLAAGDRVLLKDQTIASQNGIWVVGAALTPWSRASDLANGDNAAPLWGVCVREGTLNGKTAWALLAGDSEIITVGTDSLTFFSIFTEYPVPVAKGGTGATTAAAARQALAVPSILRGSITGDGSTKIFTVTHNLGSAAPITAFHENVGGSEVSPMVVVISTSQISVEFNTAPAMGLVINYNIVG